MWMPLVCMLQSDLLITFASAMQENYLYYPNLFVPLQCKLVCKSLLRHVSITMNKEGFSFLSIISGYTVMGCDDL